ncbi:hypothetical protein CENSYa_1460 [Cenarchaeum symbiosum A]|uniref:Uncharacterized protein n=1 Tax=Cenarchaeum symbiosum (strain A) TaxID=414004 RepID=A0RXL5_CENSY|nr:hypothetical protein CENSYa_1460 [Cenarchaeum symbiosum A]
MGFSIGAVSYVGFRNTGSPTLFRLTLAFLLVGAGFFVIWLGYVAADFVLQADRIERWVQTLGIGIQTVGYFFIAFSHSIKSFFPKNRYLRSVGAMPLILISTVPIEHILRATSFILLVYGAIETLLSYAENRRRGAIMVSLGLALLSLGEFLGWYSFVFPESALNYISIMMKIAGLISLFIPVSRVAMTRMKFDGPPGGI